MGISFASGVRIDSGRGCVVDDSLLGGGSMFDAVVGAGVSRTLLGSRLLFFVRNFRVISLRSISLGRRLPSSGARGDGRLGGIVYSFLGSMSAGVVSCRGLGVSMRCPTRLLRGLGSLSSGRRTRLEVLFEVSRRGRVIGAFRHLSGGAKGEEKHLPLSRRSSNAGRVLQFLVMLSRTVEGRGAVVLSSCDDKIREGALGRLLGFFLKTTRGTRLVVSARSCDLLSFSVVEESSVHFLMGSSVTSTRIRSVGLSLLRGGSDLRRCMDGVGMCRRLPGVSRTLFRRLLEVCGVVTVE